MKARAFWRAVTVDDANLVDQLVALLDGARAGYCVIGGQAVNAYVEPVVSLDLDLVVAVEDLPRVESLLRDRFRVEAFPHSLNISLAGSDLRVQVQLGPRYGAFVPRASVRDVLGVRLPVADVADLLQGKVWAASDATRRASKRAMSARSFWRLLERYPALRERVPEAILERLV
jgi:hypothetical protein